MRTQSPTVLSSTVLLFILAACDAESPARTAAITGVLASEQAGVDAPRFSDWSTPVNLGPIVNSPFIDQGASVSKDGLSLYFHCTGCSTGTGADIYVSQRASVDDPWGPPQPLGPNINTTSNEQAPTLSVDGHSLFFSSDRPGGFGGHDLYVSHRRDKHDDFGWELPVNLGGAINSNVDDQTPDPFEDEDGNSVLFFGRGPIGSGAVDIYVSTLLPNGTYGPGAPVTELNTASLERQPSIRKDGLEIFFASNRPGSLGAIDLWVATRARTSDPWSPPMNLGATVNSTQVDARPAISFDGMTLYFQSTRPGAVGCTSATGPCVFDLWVTTRTKLRGLD
jgi:WD40 repeat protein